MIFMLYFDDHGTSAEASGVYATDFSKVFLCIICLIITDVAKQVHALCAVHPLGLHCKV